MSGHERKPLVPRLRFPEFKDEWRLLPMSAGYTFRGNNSLSRDKLNYTNGSYRNIHYGDIHTKFSQHFHADAEPVPYINEGESHSTIRPENYCMAGDMVFADASEDMADIGKAIEIIDAGDVPLVSGLHTILARPNKGSMALGFGAYLFSSEGLRKQIQREAQGAKVLGLSPTRLGNVKLYYPSRLDEQKKIADCLSSLDDLIAAETYKLDTFKTLKKGLMQQLFPCEGETVPRLRFPEFRNLGEWKEKSISDFGEIITGSTPSTAHPEFYGGGIPFVSPADISDLRWVSDTKTTLSALGFEKTRPIKANSVLFVCIGSTIGKVTQNVRDCATNQQINSVIPNSEHSGGFVYYILSLNAERIAKLAGIQAVPIINKTQFSAVRLLVPEFSEQDRIANCLSSLDDFIAAQSQKIDVLMIHKKGLMEQLFPVMSEVG